jgi:hypothetical protein
MAHFPEALDGALRAWYPPGGIKSAVSTKRGFTARVNALEKQYGSRKAAAAAAGIGPSTWRAWFGPNPRTPSAASLAKLDRTYDTLRRDYVVKRGRIPRLMTVTAVVVADPRKSRYINKSNGGRRDFKADQLGQSGIAPIVSAWQSGQSPTAVAQVAYTAIASAYGTEFGFEGDVTVELS